MELVANCMDWAQHRRRSRSRRGGRDRRRGTSRPQGEGAVGRRLSQRRGQAAPAAGYRQLPARLRQPRRNRLAQRAQGPDQKAQRLDLASGGRLRRSGRQGAGHGLYYQQRRVGGRQRVRSLQGRWEIEGFFKQVKHKQHLTGFSATAPMPSAGRSGPPCWSMCGRALPPT